MARTNNLTDFLTDVSNAIKQKTGDSAPIPASEFDTEILSIETAGNYQEKTLNITQNGNYNLLPDQEFDAISNVSISVSVSPVLQNKTITENGSYTADQNYDGLGTVIVNVPQTGDVPVKLFETEEEMQADPTAKEGDLAVVYRSEIQNASVDSKFQVATFPDTVVLDTALTDSIEVRYRAVDSSKMFDCWGSLNSSRFMMNCYSESGEIRIEYESSDGITYTRTRLQGDSGDLENPVNFGTEIYYEMAEMWNDAIGKFIQIGESTFEGLYENKIDTNIIQFLNLSATSFSNIDLVNKNATATLNNNDKYSLKIDKSKVLSILKANDINTGACTFFVTSNNELMYTYALITLYDTTGSLLGYCLNGSYSNASSEFYKINLDNNTITQAYTKSASNHFYGSSSSDNYYYLSKDEIDCVTLPTHINSNTNTSSYDVEIVSTDSNNPLQIYVFQLNYDYQGTSTKYYLAPAQLTTLSDEVWSSTFYGKNGTGTGTLQETTNLNKTQLKTRVTIWNKYNTGLSSNNKNLSGCFSDCTDLITIPLIDTSETVNMSSMFYNCTSLKEIPLLDTSNVTDMSYIFNNCTSLTKVPLINTSKVTNMLNMFHGCSKLETIPLLDISNVTDVGAMFHGCSKLKTIPQFDISNATSIDSTFRDCISLITIPSLNTSKVTEMKNAFNGCTSLVTVGSLNASNTTRLEGTFQGCSSLTNITLLNTSKVTIIDSMFKNCTSLTTAPTLDMSNVTRTVDAFNGCTNLTTMPVWNISNVEFVYNMFAGCTSLSDESLNNILAMCINATKVSSSFKTLKNIGLTSEQANRCKTLSNYSAFTAAGWTTGY